MRRFIRASVLVLALAIPVFAGDIPNGLTGDIPNGVIAAGETPNNLTGDIPYGVTSQPALIDVLLALLSLI